MFEDKVVWITGASSGIGEALAYEFARNGAQLVLSARRGDVLEKIQATCTNPERHFVLPLDVTHISELTRHVETVMQKFGRLDVLINNAGVSQRSLVKDTALEVDRKIMEVDFFAPVALTKAVLPYMLGAGKGQLVAVSSVVGLVATPYRSAYAAAKHALAGFYNALRAEVHDSGVQVAVIYPGFVRTDVSLSALKGDGSRHGIVDERIAGAMAPEEFAQKAVAALSRGEDHIIVAGRERLAVWLGRISPALLAKAMRKVKVT
jgi:short-subunit dehydrogenase